MAKKKTAKVTPKLTEGERDLLPQVQAGYQLETDYAPPFGASLHGVIAYLVKGWSVNTI